jgi:hypothetical protein
MHVVRQPPCFLLLLKKQIQVQSIAVLGLSTLNYFTTNLLGLGSFYAAERSCLERAGMGAALGPHPSIDGQVLRLDLSRGGWLGRCRYPREAAVEKKATRELQGGPPLCKCWCVCVRDLFLPLFHPPWGAVAYWCGGEETSLGGVWLVWMPRGGPASTGSRVSARRGYQVLGSAPASLPSTSVGLAGSRDCAPPSTSWFLGQRPEGQSGSRVCARLPPFSRHRSIRF